MEFNKPKIVPLGKHNKPKKKRAGQFHYDKQHRDFRRELLAKNPLCAYEYEGCKGWATEANHLRYPATSIFDYEACCSSCHHKWHQRIRKENK